MLEKPSEIYSDYSRYEWTAIENCIIPNYRLFSLWPLGAAFQTENARS